MVQMVIRDHLATVCLAPKEPQDTLARPDHRDLLECAERLVIRGVPALQVSQEKMARMEMRDSTEPMARWVRLERQAAMDPLVLPAPMAATDNRDLQVRLLSRSDDEISLLAIPYPTGNYQEDLA